MTDKKLPELNVGVVGRFQEIEGVGVSLEGMESEVVSGVDSISEPLETGGGRGYEIWSNSSDLGDAEHTVVSSGKGTSEWVVVEVVEPEESSDTGWVDGLDSVGWVFVSDEVKGEVDVLEEEGDGVHL